MLGGDVVPQRSRSRGSQPVARALIVRPPGAGIPLEAGPSIPVHWPLDERGVVTRGIVGETSGAEAHSGLDIAVPIGTPIRAAGGGVVVRAGEDPEYGYFVRLSHPQGYQSMYGHAARLLVASGDTVSARQVIALSGSTGRSTAPHLHFEIIREGRSVDPRALLREEY
jgi:murein DD-endopeptidase MepM/ murein hydrolase activator NlpD